MEPNFFRLSLNTENFLTLNRETRSTFLMTLTPVGKKTSYPNSKEYIDIVNGMLVRCLTLPIVMARISKMT